MSAQSALSFMVNNQALVEKAKKFIDDHPGASWEPLHEHLCKFFDLKASTTRLIVMGLKVTGYIKPVGREPGRRVKKWAATHAAVTIDIEEATQNVILSCLAPRQWLSKLLKEVHESLPMGTNRDTLNLLQRMVKEKRVFPVGTKFEEGRLYPDVWLSKYPAGSEEVVPLGPVPLPENTSSLSFENMGELSTRRLVGIVDFLKACKRRGVTSLTKSELRKALGWPRSTAGYYLSILARNKVVTVQTGRGHGHETKVLL